MEDEGLKLFTHFLDLRGIFTHNTTTDMYYTLHTILSCALLSLRIYGRSRFSFNSDVDYVEINNFTKDRPGAVAQEIYK
jgi:hypothetical protein